MYNIINYHQQLKFNICILNYDYILPETKCFQCKFLIFYILSKEKGKFNALNTDFLLFITCLKRDINLMLSIQIFCYLYPA